VEWNGKARQARFVPHVDGLIRVDVHLKKNDGIQLNEIAYTM
jgi:hypothetical protein